MALEKQDSRKILNQRDEHGFTPLHWAVFRGFGDCVRIMVEKGADVNMPNGRGETSLHIAAGTGYVDIVKQLLTYGAKADYQNHTGMTPLHIAALTVQFSLYLTQI
jgi:ankyrin repeat protein